jgi:hypothetical protein
MKGVVSRTAIYGTRSFNTRFTGAHIAVIAIVRIIIRFYFINITTNNITKGMKDKVVAVLNYPDMKTYR